LRSSATAAWERREGVQQMWAMQKQEEGCGRKEERGKALRLEKNHKRKG